MTALAPLRIGSLFSGIGGFELGLEWAGVGRTVWQVERDAFCRGVLAKHWPDAVRLDDVRSVGATCLDRVDLICGGFPCQDVSSAGARKGLAGERSGLWREYARIVSELVPEWVVVENVTSGASLWVDHVVRDLEQLGYACLPIPVQADALGAPYQRARIFVVARNARLADADADAESEPTRPVNAEVACAPASCGVASGARKASDAHSVELRKQLGRGWREDWQEAPVRGGYRWHEPMPLVDGMVSGAPSRVAAQRAAGNCVVPPCAEVIGWVIRELAEATP